MGGTTATYAYNGDNLRYSKTVGGNTTTYSWDVNAWDYGKRKPSGVSVITQDGTYTYVYGHSLISQTDGSGNRTYFLGNALGSTEALTDASGTVTGTKKYDVFGAVRSSTGGASTEYLFTGEQEDATLGYTYLRARYYDPAIGRFVSQDTHPAAAAKPETVNRYAYTNNNPTNLTDPTGKYAGSWEDLLEQLFQPPGQDEPDDDSDDSASDAGDVGQAGEASINPNAPAYVDVSGTLAFGFGGTVGALYTQQLDGGYSWTPTQFGAVLGTSGLSVQGGTSELTTGPYSAIQLTFPNGVSVQAGYPYGSGGPWGELGGGIMPGVSVCVLCYVFEN